MILYLRFVISYVRGVLWINCDLVVVCFVNSLSSVRNLGVQFDSNLRFDSYVYSICKTEFFHLKKYILPMFSISNAEMFIHAFNDLGM